MILKIIRKISSIIHFQNEITIIILNYVPNKISFNKKKLTITEFGIKISVLKTLYPLYYIYIFYKKICERKSIKGTAEVEMRRRSES